MSRTHRPHTVRARWKNFRLPGDALRGITPPDAKRAGAKGSDLSTRRPPSYRELHPSNLPRSSSPSSSSRFLLSETTSETTGGIGGDLHRSSRLWGPAGGFGTSGARRRPGTKPAPEEKSANRRTSRPTSAFGVGNSLQVTDLTGRAEPRCGKPEPGRLDRKTNSSKKVGKRG